METCDVIVIGGGPAGSICAGKLRHAGLDVLLLDRDIFPRQKVCAGWITPAVLEAAGIDRDDYGQGRMLQGITGFRTGLMNRASIVTKFGSIVSYGILRSEFDNYLLQRSSVRQQIGHPVTLLKRNGGWWTVNDSIKARLLIGAGGHFCPVARLLGARIGQEAVVVAQATEYAMSLEEQQTCRIRPETPELFFCRDLKGYGWLFRKGTYLNIGLGHMGSSHFSTHLKEFRSILQQRGDLSSHMCNSRFQGHAYRLYGEGGKRSCVGDGALLIGDAAGVAHSQSGEGILPAIESALMAAETIIAAGGDYRRENLEPYGTKLDLHFGSTNSLIPSFPVSSRFSRFLGSRVLSSSWCTRHIVLDRCFLNAGRKFTGF